MPGKNQGGALARGREKRVSPQRNHLFFKSLHNATHYETECMLLNNPLSQIKTTKLFFNKTNHRGVLQKCLTRSILHPLQILGNFCAFFGVLCWIPPQNYANFFNLLRLFKFFNHFLRKITFPRDVMFKQNKKYTHRKKANSKWNKLSSCMHLYFMM